MKSPPCEPEILDRRLPKQLERSIKGDHKLLNSKVASTPESSNWPNKVFLKERSTDNLYGHTVAEERRSGRSTVTS
jgi:hypothetical protein